MKLNIFVIAITILLSGCSMLEQMTSSQQQRQDKVDALKAHNQLRALHHAPPLTWDASLAFYSRMHASHCVFKHSHTRFGENIASGYPSITAVVNAWYSEKNIYSYARPGFSEQTGHFTQVVWKSTKRVGCGVAYCDGKNGVHGQFWVCEYSPPGNVINPGYFKRNVLPE